MWKSCDFNRIGIGTVSFLPLF